MTTQTQRNEIADQMMRDCPDDTYADHETVADALRDGVPVEKILAMPVLDSYPDTYFWLKTELSA